jgi:hypothetical protein
MRFFAIERLRMTYVYEFMNEHYLRLLIIARLFFFSSVWSRAQPTCRMNRVLFFVRLYFHLFILLILIKNMIMIILMRVMLIV